MSNFDLILQTTLTPIALISGIGLLLLSMVNRYNHALDRTRQLLKEREEKKGVEVEKINQSIKLIYGRCRVIKNSILCLVSSVVFSGLLVFITALEGFTGASLSNIKGFLLLLSVGLVVLSTLLFVVDVLYSLNALRNEIET